MRSRSAESTIKLTVRAAKSSGESVSRILSPSVTGSPSAPMRVETTADPIAIASKICMRVLPPILSGTT